MNADRKGIESPAEASAAKGFTEGETSRSTQLILESWRSYVFCSLGTCGWNRTVQF